MLGYRSGERTRLNCSLFDRTLLRSTGGNLNCGEPRNLVTTVKYSIPGPPATSQAQRRCLPRPFKAPQQDTIAALELTRQLLIPRRSGATPPL